MKKTIGLIFLCILFLNNLTAISIEDLAKSDEWHNLLLDDKHGKGFVTDYSIMFACGEENYKKEIEYLINNQNEDLLNRFPARYECINRNLNLNIDYLSGNLELQEYLEKHNYDTLSISLSEPINDELESTFGHAIIILNNKDENIGNGYSINLFARTDGISDIDQIKKGLAGTLVGYFEFQEAGIIMEKYSIKLQRELVVFNSKLSKEQINRILLMLWEMKDAPIDYAFIQRNCVNGAFHLLDYALGNLELREQAKGVLMPYSLVKILKINELIEDVNTYSASSNQFGLELKKTKELLDEYEIRKSYWTDKGWEKPGITRTLPTYQPTKDKYNRPYFINNNLSYIGVENVYNIETNDALSFNLDMRFLNADTWERIFSSPRNVKMFIGKINLNYTPSSAIKLNEFILWNQASYYKYQFYNERISSEFKLAIDNKFNDNKLKPYIAISRGLSFGISSFKTIPYDPVLVYVLAQGDIIFDYLRANVGINSGILIKYPRFAVNLDTFYSIANFPYDKNKMKNNRANLISNFRINDDICLGINFDILNKALTSSLKYYYSPWGF